MTTVTHACGHKGRISLSGTAVEKSEQMFDATMRDCRKCAPAARTCPRCGEPFTDPCDPNFCENCFQDFG